MKRKDIISIQKEIGTEPDGMWGAKSQKACKEYLIRLAGSRNRFPKDKDSNILAYYGQPGDHHAVMIDVAELDIKYGQSKVNRIKCHEKVAYSLQDILYEINDSPYKSVLNEYMGVYNQRHQRGGTRLSRHSWGIAIDIGTTGNGNTTRWPQDALMPFGVMCIFARYGWTPAGVFWGRDAMHFQATKMV